MNLSKMAWMIDGHTLTFWIGDQHAGFDIYCPKDPAGLCRIQRRMTGEEEAEYKRVLSDLDNEFEEIVVELSDGREVWEGEYIRPAPDEPREEGDCYVQEQAKEYGFEIFAASKRIEVAEPMTPIAWAFEDEDVIIALANDPAITSTSVVSASQLKLEMDTNV